ARIPTSQHALQHAEAAELAATRARDIALAEQRRQPVARSLITDFAIFRTDSSGEGTATPGGGVTSSISVTHPPLSAMPSPLVARAGRRGTGVPVDLTEARHVVTSAGIDVWFLPA